MAKRTKINKKVTIILTNYNNEDYIYDAIDSILDQDYSNIELIITDDASKEFPKEKIERYIKNNKSDNIVDVKCIVNEENLGTVKTLNKAISVSTGDYITFFAADDELASKKVISNYVKNFKKSKANIITSQWIICDEKLNKIRNYVDPLKMFFLNKSGKLMLKIICQYNLFGSGATCYKKEMFEKYGLIDEDYKLLEDWPLWINLLFDGEKIKYANFKGLYHRTGGVSSSEQITETKKIFFCEMLDTFVNEILPNINKFGIFTKIKILGSFLFHIKTYEPFIDISNYLKTLFEYINKNKLVHLLWILSELNPRIISKIKILLKFNKIVPISLIITLIINFFLINIFNVKKYMILLNIVCIYIVIYYIASVISNIIINKRSMKDE